jgi:hypothetical protein
MTGLKISKSVDLGEELGILGHPRLFPLALTRGQYIGKIQVTIVKFQIQSKKMEEQCLLENGKVAMSFFFGPLCLKNYVAGITTIQALPGNSGSPVVNFWGNVVGVLFAGNDSDNWGIVVPLDQVKSFLENY